MCEADHRYLEAKNPHLISGSVPSPQLGQVAHLVVFLTCEKMAISIVAVLVCIPTNSVRSFPFLHTLSSTMENSVEIP